MDPETKGKIRMRTFCDQHSEEEIKLVCENCNVLICIPCKAANHENHVTKTLADAADEVKKNLQAKMNSCNDKLKRLNAAEQNQKELCRRISDAEQEEIKAVEHQHSQLLKILDKEVEKLKNKIANVYGELRKENTVFKADLRKETKTCSSANQNAQTLIDKGTHIEIIKKGPDLERSISKAISITDPTSPPNLRTKMFVPTEMEPSVLISLLGIMQDITTVRHDVEEMNGEELRDNSPFPDSVKTNSQRQAQLKEKSELTSAVQNLWALLASAPPEKQKQMLGEGLVTLVQRMFPDLAETITGMLLEIDNAELLDMFEGSKLLNAKVMKTIDGKKRGFGFVSFEEPESAERTQHMGQMFQAGGAGYFVPTMPQAAQRGFFTPQAMPQMRAGPRWPTVRPNQPSAQTGGFQNMPAGPQVRPARLAGTAQTNMRPNVNVRAITGQNTAQPQATMPVTQQSNVPGRPAPTNVPPQQQRQFRMPPQPSMRNVPQAQQQQTPPQAVVVQGQEPLTSHMLASAPPQEQKQMLGERLFPLIQRMYPDLAGKMTGMLLEIDNSELLHILESSESLKAKVDEAVAVLQAHHAKEAATQQAAGKGRQDAI